MKQTVKPVHRAGFRTDADIASTSKPKERELQRWVPDGDAAPLPEWTEKSSHGQEWDQFAANYDKFGVESSYDEHYYTTRINTDAPDYKERVAKAEKLAREIEGQASTDRHVLEERGIIASNDDLDEEDKYLGVDRRGGDELMAALRGMSVGAAPSALHRAPSPGKYVPPTQRAANYHNDPAIVASSATGLSRSSASPAPNEVSKEAAQRSATPQKATSPYTEAFRLTAQSEINSLREFSANFKIPHKMPSDLLPILSKDKSKQDAIAHKTIAEKPPKKKMDPTRPAFRPNPNAASFTPLAKMAPARQTMSSDAHPAYHRGNQNLGSHRPYPGSGQGTAGLSNTGNGSSSSKRLHLHNITPADFFGSASRVPTAAGQRHKAQEFVVSFSMFITAQRVHQASKDALKTLHYEKTFQTPPTWPSTMDLAYAELFPEVQPNGPASMGMGMFAMPPIGQVPPSHHPMLPTYNGNKYPSPHFSPPPRPFVPTMMYPPFQGGAGAMGIMYQGQEPQYMPPAGMVGFASLPGNHIQMHDESGAPRAGRASYAEVSSSQGRRQYNPGKRASHS